MFNFSEQNYKKCFICKKNKPNNGWVIMISNRHECYCSNKCFYSRYRISNFQ